MNSKLGKRKNCAAYNQFCLTYCLLNATRATGRQRSVPSCLAGLTISPDRFSAPAAAYARYRIAYSAELYGWRLP